MKTELIYLTDPYLKTLEATVIDVNEDTNSTYKVILDKTIIYPMGGGQATDQGNITNLENSKKYFISQSLIVEGEATLFIKSEDFDLKIGDKVVLELDWDRRFKNMKLHTAGHIIDFAIFKLGFSPKNLTPLKGDHNKDPHILYKGFAPENLLELLQAEVNKMILENLAFSWKFENLEELTKEAIYLQPGLPANKPLRMLTLQEVGSVADGGTILKSTAEVEKIVITKIEEKEGLTKVSYSL